MWIAHEKIYTKWNTIDWDTTDNNWHLLALDAFSSLLLNEQAKNKPVNYQMIIVAQRCDTNIEKK